MWKSLLILGVAIVVFAPSVASAGTTARGDDGARSDRHAGVLDAFDIDEAVPAVVKLGCEGVVEAGIGSVGCHWRGGEDLGVASWQLWNLQKYPVEGERNLVASLGGDALSYRDTNVEVPAGYVYAILGLDGDGEVVARSRVVPVRLHEPRLEHLRLTCRAHRPDVAVDELSDEVPLPDPSIGCGWSAAEHPDAVGYVLFRSVDGADRVELARFGLDTVHYTDTAVAWGHRYRYRIVAVDAEGEAVARSRTQHVGLPVPRDRVRDAENDRVRDGQSDKVRDAESDAPSDLLTDALEPVVVDGDRPSDRPFDRPGDEGDRADDPRHDGERDRPVRDN